MAGGLCCCCAGSQVQPLLGRPSNACLDPADHVVKEVRRQKIVLSRTTKLPGCFRTMVLQEFPGWNPLPTIHVAVLYFLIGALAFIILGERSSPRCLPLCLPQRYDPQRMGVTVPSPG